MAYKPLGHSRFPSKPGTSLPLHPTVLATTLLLLDASHLMGVPRKRSKNGSKDSTTAPELSDDAGHYLLSTLVSGSNISCTCLPPNHPNRCQSFHDFLHRTIRPCLKALDFHAVIKIGL